MLKSGELSSLVEMVLCLVVVYVNSIWCCCLVIRSQLYLVAVSSDEWREVFLISSVTKYFTSILRWFGHMERMDEMRLRKNDEQ